MIADLTQDLPLALPGLSPGLEQLSFQPEPGLATGDSPLPDSIGTETAPLRGEAPRSELFEPKSEQRTPYPPATSVRGGEKAAPLSAKQRGDAHRASPPAAPPPVLCPDPCWWHLDAAPLVAAHGRVGEVPGARSCSRLQPEETGGNQFLSWHISWCVKECQVSWTRAGGDGENAFPLLGTCSLGLPGGRIQPTALLGQLPPFPWPRYRGCMKVTLQGHLPRPADVPCHGGTVNLGWIHPCPQQKPPLGMPQKLFLPPCRPQPPAPSHGEKLTQSFPR